jgi:HAE1 family hydrophobic/amphiphilic exporter-1
LREFAVTIGVAILISGFISLTPRPCCAAAFCATRAIRHGGCTLTERGFQAMLAFYDRTLAGALNHRGGSLYCRCGAAATPAFQDHPKGFIPAEDLEMIYVQTECVEGISFDAMADTSRRLLRSARGSEHRIVHVAIGSRGASAPQRPLFCPAQAARQRKLNAEQIIQPCAPPATSGDQAYLRRDELRCGRASKSQYQYPCRARTQKNVRYRPPDGADGGVAGIQDVTGLELKTPS